MKCNVPSGKKSTVRLSAVKNMHTLKDPQPSTSGMDRIGRSLELLSEDSPDSDSEFEVSEEEKCCVRNGNLMILKEVYMLVWSAGENVTCRH